MPPPPPPNTQPQHPHVRHKIQQHPAVEHRHFEHKPIVEPEEGQKREGVNQEGAALPAAEPNEQAAQHRLRAEAAHHQGAGGAQMLISGGEHQPLHAVRADQAPTAEDEIGERDQALDGERCHGLTVRHGAVRLNRAGLLVQKS